MFERNAEFIVLLHVLITALINSLFAGCCQTDISNFNSVFSKTSFKNSSVRINKVFFCTGLCKANNIYWSTHSVHFILILRIILWSILKNTEISFLAIIAWSTISQYGAGNEPQTYYSHTCCAVGLDGYRMWSLVRNVVGNCSSQHSLLLAVRGPTNWGVLYSAFVLGCSE